MQETVTPERRKALSQLAKASFVPFGCKRYGVAVQSGMTYEQLIDEAGISSAARNQLHLEHDGAGAPLLVNDAGVEQLPFISLTDEDDSRALAWVDPSDSINVVGVGVDLAARGDFPFTENRVRWYRRIFTEGEMAAIGNLCPNDPDLGATLLFSAKEATFKAASQQIRKLFREAGEDPQRFGCPYFETRDIEISPVDAPVEIEARTTYPPMVLEGAWKARGINHIGNAVAAFEFLEIAGVSLRFAIVDDKALSLAVAQCGPDCLSP